MKVKPTAAEERPLNTVQRKMLDKIYSDEMDSKTSEYRNQRQDKRSKLVSEIEKKAQKKHKAVIAEAVKTAKKLKTLETTLRKDGLSLSQSIPTQKFDVVFKGGSYSRYSYGHSTVKKNKLVEKFDEETKESEAKLTDLKNEIRADIYGLQVTYTEIRAELDKKINKLKLA